MKPFLFIAFALAALAGRAQQMPSQIQAKKGVFTERLFLNGSWINGFSTDLSTPDDSSNDVLTTAKAVTDFVRMHSIQYASVTANGDYTHNWNHKGLRIDSINRLQFDAFETDSIFPANVRKVHNTIRMYSGRVPDSAINLISTVRNVNNQGDSITSRLSVSPEQAMLRINDNQGTFVAGSDGNAVYLTALHPGDIPQFSEVFVSPQNIEIYNTDGNISLHGLRSTNDTVVYKPVGYDNNTGKLVRMNTWPGGGVTAKDTFYIPVFTGAANVNTASSANSFITVTRVGNVVTVSGQVTVTASSASGTSTSLKMSLPWISVLWGPGVLSGTAFNSDYQVSAQITGSLDGQALFKFASVTTNPVNFSFSFQYQVVTLTVVPIDPQPPVP